MASHAANSSPNAKDDRIESLKAKFVGKSLVEVDVPAAVLDLAVLQRNCKQMLDVNQSLGLAWRAHIKTHKTIELTRLQVGDDPQTNVNLAVSTVTEAENIVPLLLEYKMTKKKDVNLLYAFPMHRSAVARLAKVASQLGPGGLSLLVDHPDQLEYVEAVGRLSAIGGDGMPVAPVVFIKIDAGYHRAGIWLDERVSSDGSSPGEARLDNVLRRLLDGEARGLCTLHGLYVHAGQSYDARGDAKGINSLLVEIKTLIHATRAVMRCISTGSTSSDSTGGSSRPRHLVLSAGSSPSVSQLVHIAVTDRRDPQDDVQNAALEVRSHIALIAAGIEGAATTLEMHAGVYPLQDLQQLATRALASPDSPGCMSYKDMALTILGEVASVYPNRGPGGHTDEALVTAGSLALGREPVKVVRRTHIGDGGHGIDPDHHYASWGIVMPWAAEGSDMNGQPPPDKWFPFRYKGWQVVRISQEHGILGWAGGAPAAGEAPALRVGQTVRIWPNHACIAGAGFDHYLVVDGGDRVVDVWPRWNGW